MRVIALALVAVLWGCNAETPPPPATASQATSPVISDAWVRPVPPAARMTAGYLRIYNPGPDVLVIVGAESPRFRSIEVHGTEMSDGVVRMRRQHSVAVEPGRTVDFEPGGLHLMLMEPVNGVPASGFVELSLVLEGGARLGFVAPVGQPPR